MIKSFKNGRLTVDVIHVDEPHPIEEMSILIYSGKRKDSVPKFRVDINVLNENKKHVKFVKYKVTV